MFNQLSLFETVPKSLRQYEGYIKENQLRVDYRLIHDLNNFKTPLRYPGGKAHAIHKLLPLMPKLNTFSEYRELFLGGGSMAIALTKQNPKLKVMVNDYFEPLYNFWRNLQSKGHELQEEVFKLKKNCGVRPRGTKDKDKEKRWDKTAALFNKCKQAIMTDKGNSFERAVAFYVINRVSFSGLTATSSVSKSCTDSHFTLHSIFRLSAYKELIKNWQITNKSYEEILTNNKKTFIYLDPPYEFEKSKYTTKGSLQVYGKSGSVSKAFKHNTFSENIKNIKCKCMISYNDSKEIKSRFNKWKPITFAHRYSMKSVGDYMKNQKKRNELVLVNY